MHVAATLFPRIQVGIVIIPRTSSPTPQIGNPRSFCLQIFMWLALTLGLALLMVMYAGEMYARHGGPEWSMAAVHAPATSATMDVVNRIVDVLVPRTWRAVGHMVLSTLRSLPSKVVADL